MPVVTRSQKQVFLQQVQQAPCVQVKVRPDTNDLYPWFKSVIIQRLNNSSKLMQESAIMQMRLIIAVYPLFIENIEKNIRSNYFDNLRQVSEIMYIVTEYLPDLVLCGKYKFDNFIVAVYNKAKELRSELSKSKFSPLTDDEQKTKDAFLSSVQDAEKVVVPLLPAKKVVSDNRRHIRFTYENDE